MDPRVQDNYLKAVYNAREWSDQPLTTGALAARLGLAASSVSETVRKLTDRGLLDHPRHGPIGLTPAGERLALAVVRRHRLIETFLVDYLGYGWDQVHEEAEVLEHAVSDLFVDRLDDRLGRPAVDPHGDPIPRADGSLAPSTAVGLDEAGTESPVRLERVSDDDPDLLRELQQLGMTIGSELWVERPPASPAAAVVLRRGRHRLSVDQPVAAGIRVAPLPPDPDSSPGTDAGQPEENLC